jgi:lipopolysaccharide biosynthesis glycosyltransferase
MFEKEQYAFVCCVESGALESQTLRMIESLRRWGGEFANMPVLAVIPRMGIPLASKTIRAFERLQVDYLHVQNRDRYGWAKFLNKPYAILAAENYFQSDYIVWLDSDLLFVGEPKQLFLNNEEDFVACASDRNIGTTGVDDINEPYWQNICQVVGLDIEFLPWVITERERDRIRLYWNSGIFAYRRSTNFAQEYLDTCLCLFDSQVMSRESGMFFNDQVSLGLAMVRAGLRWRSLDESHNYSLGSKTFEKWYREEKLRAAKVIHYHDAMWEWFWDVFIDCLNKTHPDVADWAKTFGVMKNEAPIQWRFLKKILDLVYQQQENIYINSCQVI